MMQKCGFTDDVTPAKDYQQNKLESLIIKVYKAWYKKNNTNPLGAPQFKNIIA